MSYSGYLRAPMRLGLGETTVVRTAVVNGAVVDQLQPGQPSQHVPVIPDDQYGSWQFTGHNKKDWAEMFFTVGNGTASGTLAVQGFQFTDAAWKQNNSQFGIGQGWVEVNSDLGFENVKFNAKAGSFWARYGMAGRYDAGEYDTYLIGRTHTMGGLASVELGLDGANLKFEGGFGTHQPNPEMYNRARFTPAGHIHAMLETESMELGIHAMHAWANQGMAQQYPKVQPGSGCGTVLDSNGDDSYTQCAVDPADTAVNPVNGATDYRINGTPGVFGPDYPAGTQTILGIDGRFDLGLAGYLYAGYSQQLLQNALVVSGAIEAIHSFGGAEFQNGVVDNYLESTFCRTAGTLAAPNKSCSNGTGGISTVMAQYELGLSNFGIMPGDMDLQFRLYGMANFMQVSDEEVKNLQALADSAGVNVSQLRQNGNYKLKFGIDTEFYPVDFMSIGVRFDRLQPNAKVAEQNFMILSPRITFRTQLVTHETISLTYSRYFYQQRTCSAANGDFVSRADSPFRPGGYNDHYGPGGFPTIASGLPADVYCAQPAPSGSIPSGFGSTADNNPPGTRGAPTLIPDENVVKIEASMWW